MILSNRLTPFALVALTAVAHAQPTPTIPEVTISTISVGRPVMAFVDTTPGVVFVVRDVNTPDRRLASYLLLGAPGTNVRSQPAQRLTTNSDGIARLAVSDSLTREVVVIVLGYLPIRFTIPLARQCRQTVEVYVSRDIRLHENAPTPPATPARVVLTTCWPRLPNGR